MLCFSSLFSTVDDEADPIGALYVALEEQNHKACSLLIEKGYKLATKLQRSLRKGKFLDDNRITVRTVI